MPVSSSATAMKPWRWALLIFELFLFALILILPQVELPIFTLHGSTAPVVAKARLYSAPVRIAAVKVTTPIPSEATWRVFEAASEDVPVASNFRLSLFCTLIC